MQLAAGAAGAGKAPFKFTSGTLQTTPEAGAVEYDGTSLYYTDGTGARHTLAASGSTNANTVAITATSSAGTYYPTFVNATTGNLAEDVGTGLTFNPSTNTLTTTTFAGALTGHASLDLPLTGGTMSGIINMGGSTIQGNSTASGNLTLDSTSNGTKGYVVLQPSGGNVGIGTTSPGSMLDVNGTVNASTFLMDAKGSTSVEAAKVTNAAEAIDISGTAATGTVNFNVASGAVMYYTANATGNFTINWRWSAGTTMNTAMAIGGFSHDGLHCHTRGDGVLSNGIPGRRRCRHSEVAGWNRTNVGRRFKS